MFEKPPQPMRPAGTDSCPVLALRGSPSRGCQPRDFINAGAAAGVWRKGLFWAFGQV